MINRRTVLKGALVVPAGIAIPNLALPKVINQKLSTKCGIVRIVPTKYLGSTYIECVVLTPRYNPIENKYDTNIQTYSGDIPNRGVVPEGNRGLVVPIEESSYLSITTKDLSKRLSISLSKAKEIQNLLK